MNSKGLHLSLAEEATVWKLSFLPSVIKRWDDDCRSRGLTPKTLLLISLARHLMESRLPPHRRGRGRSCSTSAREVLRKLLRFTFTNVGIVGLILSYAVMGAHVFIYLEKEASDTRASAAAESSRHLEDAVESLWNITYSLNILYKENWTNLVDREILQYQRQILGSALRQTETLSASHQNLWSFPGGILYSLTVITTIGYGYIVPQTAWGKVCTIVYAIFGIPLFLLYLATIGDILATSFKWLYVKVFVCVKTEPRNSFELQYLPDTETGIREVSDDETLQYMPQNMSSDPYVETRVFQDYPNEMIHSSSLAEEARVPISLCIMIIILYIIAGAMLFSNWENDWSFLESSYFCFISLSTIGLGDFFPGQIIRASDGSIVEYSFIFCSLYLLLGMALMAMCFNLMQEEVINKIRNLCQRCGILEEQYYSDDYDTR